MQKYDVALKSILTRGTAAFLSRVMGIEVSKFLNSELPDVRSPRADLLGEARDGTLFHLELQSTNDSRMAFRMLDYLIAIERAWGQIPRQLVLYVGEAEMKMQKRILADGLSFQIKIVDLRSLEGELLLQSESLDENIMRVLARQPDQKRAVRRVLEKIAASEPERRATAVRELTILAGLRSLGSFVKEESQRMPILTDIMDHDLLGPLIREGIATGRADGERALFLKLIAKRFGQVPDWASQRIAQLGVEEVEELGLRFLDVQSLEELFGTK